MRFGGRRESLALDGRARPSAPPWGIRKQRPAAEADQPQLEQHRPGDGIRIHAVFA
jgi:hypothetical protein